MMTRNSAKNAKSDGGNKQVMINNFDDCKVVNSGVNCSDNLGSVSCNGLMLGSTNSSNYSACSSARNKLKLAKIKARQLERQLELEDRLRSQENVIKLQKAKDEIEVAEVLVEAEEEEENLSRSQTSTPDKVETLSNYLKDCRLSVKKNDNDVSPNYAGRNPVYDGVANNHSQPVFDPCPTTSRDKRPIYPMDNFQGRASEPRLPQVSQYKLELPKVELTPFFGDVTDYWRFCKQFEFYVEARTPDPGQRLLYLMNYCRSVAKEEIKNCIMLPPAEAYDKARERLRDRFGQSHVIARALINDMLGLPKMNVSDPTQLLKMSSVLSDCNLVLGQMNYLSDINSVQTISRLVSKLPLELRQSWSIEADRVYTEDREPNIDDLIHFINIQARIARSAYGRLVRKPENGFEQSRIEPVPYNRDRVNHKSNMHIHTTTVVKGNCPYCKECHQLVSCTRFMKLTIDERWNEVRKMRLCFLCLKGNHQVRECSVIEKCTVKDCGRRHHKLLHQEKKITELNVVKINACNTVETVQLGTIPVWVKGLSGYIKTYALLDNGSDSTLVKASLFDRLKLKGKSTSINIRTVTGEQSVTSVKCNLEVCSLDMEHRVQMSDVFTVECLPSNSHARSPAQVAKDWSHLRDIEFQDIGEREVGLLIGCDTPEAHWVLDQRLGNRKQPFAVRTVLGWMLLGPNGGRKETLSINTTMSEETQLWDFMVRLYNTEFNDLGAIEKELSQEERRALDIVDKGTKFENGRYTVPLPWKDNRKCLPNNRNCANKRVQLLRKRFDRTAGLFEKYKAIMDEHIKKGFVERVAGDRTNEKAEVWYLPHHPVLNPKKPGKVRVVFDCAAKYEGTSLNDCLLSGPDTLTELVGVLMRFRIGAIAITADIEEMFLQVQLPHSDRSKMRFLWWDDEDTSKPPSDYQLTVHPFGATSSPFCANSALRRTVRDFGNRLSEQSRKAVNRDVYVDDCITSVDDVNTAITVANELTNMFHKTGFRLRKWMSNNRDVLTSLPETERSDKIVSLSDGPLPTERTLGVTWDAESDSLKFLFQLEMKANTRRGILANVASMFDPLGLLAPFTLVARILLQDICREARGWDEQLSNEEIERWHAWKDAVINVGAMTVPRRVFYSNLKGECKVQLHVFCDASEVGYGAAAYVRCEIEDGIWESNLLIGKARVAPIKKVTIPRLELTAAVLATRVGKTVEAQLGVNFEKVVYWTDSVLVLRYIRNTSTRFVTFVANRVQEILESTKVEQWKYVNTKVNPADMASRGSILKGDAVDRWFKGPPFLRKPEETWTTLFEMPDGEVQLETKKTVLINTTETTEMPLDRLLKHFSEWSKMVKSVAWFRRWKSAHLVMMGKHTRVQVGVLQLQELKESEKDILQYVQKQAYPAEWKHSVEDDGTSRKRLLRRSTIGKLNPIVKDGLLCVGGRLEASDISENRKWPIILPRNHPVTTAIIWEIHRKEGHAGPSHVLGMLRDRFWVVNAKAIIRRIYHNCLKCRKLNVPLSQQQMAPLPEIRVTNNWRPFSAVGVDYFGPFYVKRGRLLEKRYGCMFTCLQCRAIHVELTQKLSMDAFLLALSRFIDRRGTPSEIYSDNGGNFIGADNELRKQLEVWDTERLSSKLNEHHISWTFNPPMASHRGGVWERMIRSVRRILYTSIGTRSVEEEVLLTYLVHAERVVNDRPLVQIDEDDLEKAPLRPSDLLRARDTQEVNISQPLDKLSMDRWKSVSDATNTFWRRWTNEYLPNLQLRQKWLIPDRKYRVGDLVIVWTESVPKGYWPMGIVTEVEEGADGLVRTVSVRTIKGTMKRDVRKVCLLEGTS